MKRDWKPGDVALVTRHGGEPAVMVRDDTNTGWHGPDGGTFYWDKAVDHWALDAIRPLVVIDPESDADIARVENALEALGCRIGTNVQAALRSLVTPPRPEEPTGLGAVVEDADGRVYVRTADTDCVRAWSYANNSSDHDYADVRAVHVLSEGVTL